MKKIIYYAHGVHLYGSLQEQRDVNSLEDLGFEVVNPNSQEVKMELELWKQNNPDSNYMEYFTSLVDKCDAVAFRPLIDGSITSRVVTEVQHAIKNSMPIIELPNLDSRRFLSLDDTRLMLQYLGQR